jgi:heat shock protein HslJ
MRTTPFVFSGLAALASCSSTPHWTPPIELAGTSWRVHALNGGGLEGFGVTIRFEEERAIGRASCNDYRFAYSLDGRRMEFADTLVVTTDRVCDLDAQRIEESFLATLGEVDRVGLQSSGTLVLYAGPAGRIVARPA